MKAWQFRRAVVRAAQLKRMPEGFGVRPPERGEVPLSDAEILHGALHGIIRLPRLSHPATLARVRAATTEETNP